MDVKTWEKVSGEKCMLVYSRVRVSPIKRNLTEKKTTQHICLKSIWNWFDFRKQQLVQRETSLRK